MARPEKFSRIMFAQEQHERSLLGLPNVLGVASGRRQRGGKFTDELCVQVFVQRKLPEAELSDWARVPDHVVGYQGERVRTDVIVMSVPDAQQDTTRYRPVRGGVSIGPESSVSAGTLGGWACDNTDDTIVLLSNNHVISNLDTMPAAGRIVQPGRLDGGTLPGDVIGDLKRHIALATVANPPTAGLPAVTQVDAAVGTIDVARQDQVVDIGPAVYEVQAPAVDMDVQKRGRTTRLTTNGRITSVNGTFNVTYRNRTRLGRIANTFVVTSTDGNEFSRPGDSGSLIFNQAEGQVQGTRPVVGLLYAGGTLGDGTPVTLGNDINAVFGALNLSTVCTCVVRALLRSLSSSGRQLDDRSASRFMRFKESQLRSLREQILRASPFGKVLDGLMTVHAAEVGSLLTEDEEAFGLAVRLLEPWVYKVTNLEILDAEVDEQTLANAEDLVRYIVRQRRDLRAELEGALNSAKAMRGVPVRRLLREAARKQSSKKQPPKKQPPRRK
jgi:hypothetical protein